MKLFLLALVTLALGTLVGMNISSSHAFHSIPTQHNYCGGSECWWWERVADGGTAWTRYGNSENRWAIDWEDGYCGNIDSSCGPNHMHWLKNANSYSDGHSALWDHTGEAEAESVTKVWIYIPDVHSTTQQGRYETLFNWGVDSYTVDQLAHSDEWVLGTEGYYGQRTYLEGFTYEPKSSVDIGFDEIQQNYHQ
jgi:hypothetical protein